MEGEQEQLQSLGCIGTIRESFKIVFSWKRIFTHITLTLILPLSFIYLAQMQLSVLVSSKINSNNQQTHTSRKCFSKKSYLLWLFDLAYFIFFLTLYLLSTAAVVYTIACIFTAKQTTFKKVISAVPRVWKRLLVTFLWTFAFLFVYNVVGIGVMTLLAALLAGSVAGIVVIVVIFIVYLVGLVYISIVWQLASVVSVLEEKYGLKAMKKSRNLMKGKMGLAVGMFILFCIFFGGVDVLFAYLVVSKWSHNLAIAIPVAILCLVLLCVVILFGLVVQTIIYFVCKSYHNETIDKSPLSVRLEEYLGDNVRLNRSNDVERSTKTNSGQTFGYVFTTTCVVNDGTFGYDFECCSEDTDSGAGFERGEEILVPEDTTN